MEITKVVKPFIRRGWPNTFGNIVYVCVCVYVCMYIYIYIYIYIYTQSRFIIVRSLFKKLICDIEHVNKIKFNYVEKVKSNIASQI